MIIYKITNAINNKIYIGQTVRKIKYRWKDHIRSSIDKTNHPLYNAMRKYGVENFTVEEIGGANSQSELNYKEWLLIHKNNTLWPNGYNLKEGGGSTGKMTLLAKKANSYAQKEYFKNNPQHNSKKVVNIETGQVWESASCCLKENNIKMSRSNFTNKLSGKTGNETPFRYVGMENVCKKPGIGAPKKVINIKTGEVWGSVNECGEFFNIPYDILKNKLNGTTINNTSFRYLGEENVCKKRRKQNKKTKTVIDSETGICYRNAQDCAQKKDININTLRKWLNPKNNIKSRYIYGR